MPFKNYSEVETPSVSAEWSVMSAQDRVSELTDSLSKSRFGELFSITRAEPTGFVYVNFSTPIQASKRGMLLLDLEEYFKKNLDPGISLWCEPLGDKNSLRNLRGIQIKSGRDQDEISK
jgi:hypothetical protein